MAAFYIPPCILFVRCGGEAVFFVCSEDYPEVIYQNVNLLIPTLCVLVYTSISKCITCPL